MLGDKGKDLRTQREQYYINNLLNTVASLEELLKISFAGAMSPEALNNPQMQVAFIETWGHIAANILGFVSVVTANTENAQSFDKVREITRDLQRYVTDMKLSISLYDGEINLADSDSSKPE